MSGFMLETKLGAAMVDLTVGPDTKPNESLVTRLSPALEKFGIAPKCIILLIVDGANYKLSSLLEKIKTLEHVVVIRCQAHGLSLCFEYMAGYKIPARTRRKDCPWYGETDDKMLWLSEVFSVAEWMSSWVRNHYWPCHFYREELKKKPEGTQNTFTIQPLAHQFLLTLNFLKFINFKSLNIFLNFFLCEVMRLEC